MEEFNWQEILFKYRYVIGVSIGLILIILGSGIFVKQLFYPSVAKTEVLSVENTDTAPKKVIVEIGGAVLKSGVYKLPLNSRIDDLLIASGGLSPTADSSWVDKMLNRAAKLTDGQKIYIPEKGQSPEVQGQQTTNGLVNINTAPVSELDALPGIGTATAQKIIDNRPYSAVDELISKKILKQSVYDNNQNKLSVY